MKVRLTFSVVVDDEPAEIEMMQEQVGQAFDVSNDTWTFHDVALDAIREEVATL